MSPPCISSTCSLGVLHNTPQVTCLLYFYFVSPSSSLSPTLFPFPPSLHSHRMLINSTRASCQSSPPWRLSTPRPRLAATGEARATNGTPRTLEGLNPLTRKPCSHAGKERQTTAPSPPSSDSPMAPATRSRDTPTMGRGQRPQSNLFLSGVFLFLYSDIRYSDTHLELS